jgi:RNA polymerase sigma-70 factor (ECF subfamily)
MGGVAPHQPDPAAPPDAVLLARAAGGDASAFATLYERHAPSVMAFVWHLTWDRTAAEDAVQETFLRVWRAAGRFRAGARLEPWLFRIARRAAYDARRRRREAPLGEVARGTPADATARGAEAARALREAVDGLRERLRLAFVLVRLEGRSYAEAAALLDVPEGTVKSRVAAAEAVVRRRLERFA